MIGQYKYIARSITLLALWSIPTSTCSAFTHPPSSSLTTNTNTNTFMWRQPPATISSPPASKGVSRRHARELPQHESSTTPTLTSIGMDVKEDFNNEISISQHGSSHQPSLYSTTMEIEEFASPQQKRFFSVNLDAPTLPMGRILVLVASLIYGTNFATVKMLDDTLPLSISATLRFGLASALVAALVLSKEDENVEPIVIKERNLAMSSGLEIGMWYCIGYICQAEGLQTVTAGKSAFYNSLAVVVVPLLDALFKSKVLTQRDLASIALACIGVGFLELGPTGDLVFSLGDLLCLGQTFAFGVGYWRLESESQKHPHHASRLVVGQLAAVAGGSAIYCFAELGIRDFPSIDQLATWLGDPFIIAALLWTGLISTALALYLETVALKVVSARELTLLMTTISLWGALFGFLALGEVLTRSGMFGGALILAGCVLGNISPPPKEKDEPAPVVGAAEYDYDIEAAP